MKIGDRKMDGGGGAVEQTEMVSYLPSVGARLPAIYEQAKQSLATCDRVDECQDWADRAAAMASYAKQANDEELHVMALRIRARAIRRCGELLQAIPSTVGKPKAIGVGAGPITKSSAAADAGLSRRQKQTALRVANAPDFEDELESDSPPTLTELANRGKKPAPKPLIDLNGRDPKDFAAATSAIGNLGRLVEFAEATDPAAIARGCNKKERVGLLSKVDTVSRWLIRLRKELR